MEWGLELDFLEGQCTHGVVGKNRTAKENMIKNHGSRNQGVARKVVDERWVIQRGFEVMVFVFHRLSHPLPIGLKQTDKELP